MSSVTTIQFKCKLCSNVSLKQTQLRIILRPQHEQLLFYFLPKKCALIITFISLIPRMPPFLSTFIAKWVPLSLLCLLWRVQPTVRRWRGFLWKWLSSSREELWGSNFTILNRTSAARQIVVACFRHSVSSDLMLLFFFQRLDVRTGPVFLWRLLFW